MLYPSKAAKCQYIITDTARTHLHSKYLLNNNHQKLCRGQILHSKCNLKTRGMVLLVYLLLFSRIPTHALHLWPFLSSCNNTDTSIPKDFYICLRNTTLFLTCSSDIFNIMGNHEGMYWGVNISYMSSVDKSAERAKISGRIHCHLRPPVPN